jgi:RNA polymerase sigma-70 factor (ECF subfamily)
MKEEDFRKVVDENYGRISRICLHYFGSREEADDACQEVLLKVWLNIDKFRGESSLSTWISRIAVNVCMTTFRNKKTDPLRLGSEELKHLGDKMPDENYSGDEEEEKLKFFHAFMQKLPAADRTLVSLYLEDMESADIAEVTGLSDANVRTRIHRIKKQIKEDWEVRYGTR